MLDLGVYLTIDLMKLHQFYKDAMMGLLTVLPF